ncbi:DUF4760 domain-containing protein [Avibacterium gallinarum]|uniref:DUF4760 domain-containing protein n=1 Tax=Avibacterium gallinarum TaxID=755 RepID=UPI0039FC01A1
MKKAPSYKLGAFCLCLSLIYILLIIWRLFPCLEKLSLLGIEPHSYLRGKWISTISIAFIPAIGWLFSGYISVKNLTKQNSMNILLQTRTSAEYMSHARIAQKYIESNSLPTTEKDKNSIIYMLNFLEFVSIGIISGELDENIFKRAWKNTFRLSVENHAELIQEYQRKISTIWSNLVWLNLRWQSSKKVSLPQNNLLRKLCILLLVYICLILFGLMSSSLLFLISYLIGLLLY